MTPEEHQIIASYATTVYKDTISLIIVNMTGFGVSLLGIFIASRILVTKRWTRSRIALFSCLITIFTTSTWASLGRVTVALIQDQVLLAQIKPKVQGVLEAAVKILDKRLLSTLYMATWSLTSSMLLNDLIVIWRAWILFQRERFWQAALVLLMVVNIGIQIADCILDNINVKAQLSGSDIILDWISAFISMVVNMFATGLIAWRAWQVLSNSCL
ncbi:hypothetical protein GYMLUDRAFT_249251 [Collybiopsis luxurians FD-317 M1]|uniref:Uncharacterized protein n=1 Tax=Collybiopsis luxurians FD-317 M1 TaxID=944289 RepID=A0A0D0CIB7_9AGAR|nr:hypothetical protein GYMLUDRAFT_249251 [Collybiopsis luxurians FD-317 M1]